MSKRKQVKNACVNCQRACKRCDDSRPCLRCVKYGLGDECVDSLRKERQRGTKRGPYNKRSYDPVSPSFQQPVQMSAQSLPPTVNIIDFRPYSQKSIPDPPECQQQPGGGFKELAAVCSDLLLDEVKREVAQEHVMRSMTPFAPFYGQPRYSDCTLQDTAVVSSSGHASGDLIAAPRPILPAGVLEQYLQHHLPSMPVGQASAMEAERLAHSASPLPRGFGVPTPPGTPRTILKVVRVLPVVEQVAPYRVLRRATTPNPGFH